MKKSIIHYRLRFTDANQRAFTLTELAIVLGVIGLILSAIWVAAGTVSEKNRINQAFQELQAISQNILTLDQNRPFAVAGNDNAAMIATGAIPNWAISLPATIIHPWSPAPGLIVYASAVSANPQYSIANRVFRVSFYNVPTDGCIALLMQGTGCDPSQTGCPVAVYTAGTNATPSAHNQIPAGAPLSWQAFDPMAAQTLCNFNAPAANSVEFDFSL
jgi:prepilin-type N-terminal cleavage/methylation domain-containing protein